MKSDIKSIVDLLQMHNKQFEKGHIRLLKGTHITRQICTGHQEILS